MKADIPSIKKIFSVVRTAAWLSPAAMYSPFGPCGRQGHRICAEALGRLRPLHGICLMAACQHLKYNGTFHEHAQSVLTGLSSFRGRNVISLKHFLRLLGHMASAARITSYETTSALVTLPSPEMGMVSWHTVACSPWTALHATGRQLWTGPQLLWHINCLELFAVYLALWQFQPLLQDKRVLVRTDNTTAVSYFNRQGGLWYVACHSSPVTFSGVRHGSSRCALSTFRGSSIV